MRRCSVGYFLAPASNLPTRRTIATVKNGLIYETNKREAPGAKVSSKMDFSRPDAAGAAQLNRVLWRDQKGSAPMPEAKHTVFPAGGD